MDEENITNVAKEVVQTSDNNAQFSVVPIPFHQHTGVDSNPVSANNLTDLVTAWSKQIYVADTASNDTYVVAMAPSPASYFTGLQVNFKATTANTGAATLNVNGLGAIAIKKNKSATLADNDILAGQIVTVIYDGTNFQMQSQMGNSGVTTVSVVTANGLAGTVANATTTPAITLTTSISGVLKGNGTAISAAVNSDLPAMSATVGGAVPTPPNNTTTFLRGDGTFAAPAASPAQYVFGVATGYSTNASANDGNHDQTITTTFTPTMIKLYYFLQGHTRNASTNIYVGRKGMVIFNGTTLLADIPIWGDGNVNGDQLTGDNGHPTVIAASSDPFLPNYTNGVGDGANNLTVGDVGFSGDARMTLTIASVSSTSFVIRFVSTVADVSGNTARGMCTYEAWA